LGLLLEDPAACQPLGGEVWRAVFLLRKSMRAVLTNLTQIADARTARGTVAPAALGVVRTQLEAGIRACLDAQATIAASGQAVAA
jgi:hypothetical protein